MKPEKAKLIKKQIKILSTIVILFLGLVVFFLIQNNRVERKLELDGRYTIASGIELQTTQYSSFLTCKYSVNDSNYYVTESVERNKYSGKGIKNVKLYVKYSSEKPEISRLIYKYYVPKSRFVPKNGWEQIPGLEYEK